MDEFKSEVPDNQIQLESRFWQNNKTSTHRGSAGASCEIPEISNSKHYFYDVQMLTKDRGHERADKLMYITPAGNAGRLPYLYGRSINFSAADIISVVRNEHDEDEHQRTIFSDLHLWLQVKRFSAVSVDKKIGIGTANAVQLLSSRRIINSRFQSIFRLVILIVFEP